MKRVIINKKILDALVGLGADFKVRDNSVVLTLHFSSKGYAKNSLLFQVLNENRAGGD